MSWLRYSLVALASVLLGACTLGRSYHQEVLPIDSIVSGQVNYLSKVKTHLVKEARVNGRNEHVVLEMGDSVAWFREIGALKKLSAINKAKGVLRQGKPKREQDTGSNLEVISYMSQGDAISNRVNVYYLPGTETIKKIEGEFHETSPFSTVKRILSMGFQDVGGKQILTGYSIYGFQKSLLGDSVEFQITGEISIYK